jgi:hypothetical protein
MSENFSHPMTLVRSDEHSEEWYCPQCGRRFVMSWPPEFKRVILKQGDLTVIHTGSKSPFGKFLDLQQTLMVNAEEEPLPPEFEEWWKGRKK